MGRSKVDQVLVNHRTVTHPTEGIWGQKDGRKAPSMLPVRQPRLLSKGATGVGRLFKLLDVRRWQKKWLRSLRRGSRSATRTGVERCCAELFMSCCAPAVAMIGSTERVGASGAGR